MEKDLKTWLYVNEVLSRSRGLHEAAMRGDKIPKRMVKKVLADLLEVSEIVKERELELTKIFKAIKLIQSGKETG